MYLKDISSIPTIYFYVICYLMNTFFVCKLIVFMWILIIENGIAGLYFYISSITIAKVICFCVLKKVGTYSFTHILSYYMKCWIIAFKKNSYNTKYYEVRSALIGKVRKFFCVYIYVGNLLSR